MSNAIASDFLDHSSLCVRNDSTRTKNREGWVGSLVECALVLGLGEHENILEDFSFDTHAELPGRFYNGSVQ